MDQNRPTKRVKISDNAVETAALRERRAAFLNSLSRPVSPPPSLPPTITGRSQQSQTFITRTECIPAVSSSQGTTTSQLTEHKSVSKTGGRKTAGKLAASSTSPQCLPSPISLTKIRDLPASENVDTIGPQDILGDPLIKEAWVFNFCFDVDWLMQHFDEDVCDTIQVKIVHGSWRREDMNKMLIDDACSRRPNVSSIQAYLPDNFGTHHSKMFILLRHDDFAQIVIHTANILEKDWGNMTQALWKSPLLPLREKQAQESTSSNVGNEFKADLIRYLKAYGHKLKPLTQQLQLYSFDQVKAALVASVPSKFKVSATDGEVWGHEMLRRKLDKIAHLAQKQKTEPHFVFQVSSIASLPAPWLKDTLYSASKAKKENTSIIFPTAPDVANSLDGYASGGSIHTKAQSATHLKQISSMQTQLCRWSASSSKTTQAGRDLAAPHIKTYTRFSSKATNNHPKPDVDWALVTSANLSTQAWGSAPRLAKGEKDSSNAIIHIQSYEIGVLVWPQLFLENGDDSSSVDGEIAARMVPVFKRDTPNENSIKDETVIGLRMPYDLPLTPYHDGELPWSPQSSYNVPDRHGSVW